MLLTDRVLGNVEDFSSPDGCIVILPLDYFEQNGYLTILMGRICGKGVWGAGLPLIPFDARNTTIALKFPIR